MRVNSFASAATVTAATNLFIAGIGMLTGVLAARTLGVEGRGELAAIQLWPSSIATIAMLGLSDALVYLSAKDPKQSARYVATAVVLALVSGCAFIGGGYVAMPFLMGGQSAEVISAARWYLAVIPIFAITGLPYHVLRGHGDFVAWNAARVTPNLMWLLVLSAAAIWGFASPQSVAMAYLGALLVLGVALGYVVRWRVRGEYVPRFSDMRPLLHFGVRSLSTAAPNILTTRVDQMLFVAFFTPSMLGLYVVALAWAGAVTPILSAIAAVTFPRVANARDIAVRNANYAKAVRMSVVAAVITVIPVALLTPVALPLLFGANFSSAITASVLLTISAAVAGVNQVLEEGLRGVGRPASILFSQGVGLPVLALTMLALLPSWGLEGASVACIAGGVTTCIVLLRVARSITGIPIEKFCLPTVDDLTLLITHFRRLMKNGLERGLKK